MGKILIVEFNDEEETVFGEVVQVLQQNSHFSSISLPDENTLSIPGIAQRVCKEAGKIVSA